MPRRSGLSIVLSVLVIATSVYASWAGFQPDRQLPFMVRWANGNQALIKPIPGLTPASLHAGDRLDLVQQSLPTRIALIASRIDSLPASASYPLVLGRGPARVKVIVHAVESNHSRLNRWATWIFLYDMILYASVALLALWRGHDRAALGIAVWAMAEGPLAGALSSIIPSSNWIVLLALLGTSSCILVAQAGFYVMAESISGSAVAPGVRARWRGLFALVLGFLGIVVLVGPIALVEAGWSWLWMRKWLLAVTYIPSFLVPIALLVVSFRHADVSNRKRLRWLIWGSILLVSGPALDFFLPLGEAAKSILANGLTLLAIAAILYAVLRHRVINVTVAINRALVYALTTSLVLGLFALLESLIERSALSRGAGLVLELAVPLGLGAALSTVHRRIEATVERYIFRRQYRTETALRRFAEECGFIRKPENLFKVGIAEIARHTDAPCVALYERSAEDYVCRGQMGEPTLPEQIPTDDPAFIGLRARNAEFALHDARSTLGSDGYAYPLMLRGDLLGALVIAERPGEHYAADERALFFHVAHEIGMALFALRAQESEMKARENEMRARESELLLQEARMREAALWNALGTTGPGNGAR